MCAKKLVLPSKHYISNFNNLIDKVNRLVLSILLPNVPRNYQAKLTFVCKGKRACVYIYIYIYTLEMSSGKAFQQKSCNV